MILPLFIHAVTTFNIETLKRFGNFVFRYESDIDKMSTNLLEYSFCNNVYMTSDYVNTPYVLKDTKFIVVKHILKSTGNGKKPNIWTEESECADFDRNSMKKLGFLSWFYSETKNRYLSDVLNEDDEDLKKLRTDIFSKNVFTIVELKKQTDDFKQNAKLLYTQKQTYFDGLNLEEFLFMFFDTADEFKAFTFI